VEGQKLTELCAHRLHPLVPLVKVGWWQGRAKGSEEGQVMTSRLLEYATEERSRSFGSDLFGCLHFFLGGLRLGRKVQIGFGSAA
jgi:hypothetical protein